MQQILSGLLYLHEQLIIHRNLKPDNILYGSRGCVNLADLGLARKGLPQPAEKLTLYVMTRWYGRSSCSSALTTVASISTWSLSCILGQLLIG